MRGAELRQRFLDYFQEKGHALVPSASLIPHQDPTLLFTNAGMVPFKRVFLGEERRDYSRAASYQRCVRAGGKHNDLENVGHTARHHTFFEMLGNFSFGDYFKREAIGYAWEFLTQRVGLEKERLYATVYKEDDEAFKIWNQEIGLEKSRIRRLGEEDNFWAMGETGPCGPCSELIYDQGASLSCGKTTCDVGCDCDRYLEIWNLVFMQLERDASGKLKSLPKPSIDTGMGLERLTAIVQGVPTNYDTDLFYPLLQRLERETGRSYPENPASFRVIADHARAVAFLIGDGVLPSNEGRGYVLRRIMRRAARHGKLLGLEEPFLYLLSSVVVSEMQAVYPELKGAEEHISKVIRVEEERFLETLDRGLQILSEEIKQLQKKRSRIFPGGIAFRLYDTYGFPVDLTETLLADQGFQLDSKGFEKEMVRQQGRGREAWKGSGEKGVGGAFAQLISLGLESEFVGYDRLEEETKVIALHSNGSMVEEISEGGEGLLVAEKTPFYGEGGGQVGDQGTVTGRSASCFVEDAQRPIPKLIVHRIQVQNGTLRRGDQIRLSVDGVRRQRIRLNHTATHLMHAALRQVLGTHVKQAGSLVAPDRLRFDFSHFTSMTSEEIQKVEDLVNQKISENIPLHPHSRSYKEALNEGALAFFGDKYEETVRVIEVPGFSKELCGGTHVDRTGDISFFKMTSESGIAAGVRRIEAVTGDGAVEFVREMEKEIQEAARLLKAAPNELGSRIQKLLQTQKEKEQQIEKLKRQEAQGGAPDILASAQKINGISVLSAEVSEEDPKHLREMAENLRKRLSSGIVVLGARRGEKVSLVAAVSSDLQKSYSAKELLNRVAALVGGSGGGRDDFAQAGGSRPQGLTEALQSVYRFVQEKSL
ncbi:MAG: alanine--tRNA ligase [Deltaproteobacteria bacterium]|nr:alanine--tRNA ligase [Deltaproteobacteria bacterium]